MTKRAAGSNGVERGIQTFLETLAAHAGEPMEAMTPAEARGALVSAQSSVPNPGVRSALLHAAAELKKRLQR